MTDVTLLIRPAVQVRTTVVSKKAASIVAERIPGPPGKGLPVGGAPGQIPVKASAADYDISWVNPPSDSGIGGFVYTQSVAAAQWTITHGLGRFPSVTVVDSAGDQCIGDVRYLDLNTVVVTFGAAFAGNAYLN